MKIPINIRKRNNSFLMAKTSAGEVSIFKRKRGG
jgi:hypothetical protein